MIKNLNYQISGLTLSEAPIIMTLAYSRQIDQWNRTEQLETDPCISRH